MSAEAQTSMPISQRSRFSSLQVGVTLLVLLAFTIVIASAVGVTSLSPSALWNALTDTTSPLHPIVWEIRFPRIALALLVGAGLGVAGAVAQAIFANPIAEPSIIGIGSGSALGLLLATAFGFTSIGSSGSVLAALVGALLTSLALVRWTPQTPIAFLLSGIALAAVMNSLIGLTTALSARSDLRSISFWSLGSLSLATWSAIAAITPFVLVGLANAVVLSNKLDYLALGNARHLGISANQIRVISLISLSFLVAGSVALTGLITFVGLVVPHVLRLIVGPTHRSLISLSALAGALLVLIADTSARALLQPMELPIGLLTALIGAPILLVSIRSLRSQP